MKCRETDIMSLVVKLMKFCFMSKVDEISIPRVTCEEAMSGKKQKLISAPNNKNNLQMIQQLIMSNFNK